MKILITGGAGFIGTNLAAKLLKKGKKVTIFDNLSRKGTELNLKWLQKKYPSVRYINGDIRDVQKVNETVPKFDAIYHLAAQVAVTTSVMDPQEDFEINIQGTFNILEAIRKSGHKPMLLYASTNKVYGDLSGLEVQETKTRYKFKTVPNGVTENQCLDFHSPYGCSKGAADQYVRDYARIYDFPTVVFRQSCIYGPHQFGIEDQGWVAWFAIATMVEKPLTVYGNGKQTRDILFVDDLCDAYIAATKKIKKTAGQIYNIGGGKDNSISVWFEFREILERLIGKKIKAKFSGTRPGDQPLFISDNSKARKEFGWYPKTAKEAGIKKMIKWMKENREEIKRVFTS
jgi:CDP-paratose 2-epimerase